MPIEKKKGAKTPVYTREPSLAQTIKRDLRVLFKAIRESIGEEERAKKSAKIFANLKARGEYNSANTVFIYVSCGSEAETHEMLEKIVESGKKVLIPFTDKNEKKMKAVVFERFDRLKKNDMGILEPSAEEIKPVDASEIDLVITPGLAFDKQGFRLGYGGGYYDKFFDSAGDNEMYKVGICFFEQMSEFALPKGEHDVPVDCVITDQGIFERGKD